MRNRVERFVSKYRKRGILVDTNLLLLYVVGAYDANHIERFKRTSTFTADDFDLLARLLGNFEAIVTTPPILTEVSNFVGQLSQGHRRPCTRLLQRLIPELEEEHRASSSVSAHDYFLQFRLTDAGIADISAGTYLVVTDDLPLYHALANDQEAVLNFNHLRTINW